MALTLVHAGLSPYGIKVKLILLEKGIPYYLEKALPWNLEDHPRRQVPVLRDGKDVVVDSRIISEYLEDKYPKPSLWPTEPLERARARTVMDVVDTHLEAINWGLGELYTFQRAGGPSTPLHKSMVAASKDQTARFFTWLSTQLSDDPASPYFGGAVFSITDCAVVSQVIRSVGLGNVPAAGSRLAKWWSLVQRRPSVKKVLEEELQEMSASRAGAGGAIKALNDGAFKREYRDHRLEWMIRTGGISIVAEGLSKGNIRFVPDDVFEKGGKL
ncbi:glutathione S-transferase domain-containing protein [Gonapodya prolifera JEL478]|uniref:Glutathione S-transferase domain-containing protein n=1 Tax=Gonapodya prolifera (strain JEL478) TaxID=1344416 RepID=A0A139AZZ3_GONPJ|nr:glutathione S-transferase domain-containing protein [Gonapodya prolifera JEL478]|eukprot:KXS22284.1 glutathione S-transferase domain-containing protein [Gonapodya prolifera JEL478]